MKKSNDQNIIIGGDFNAPLNYVDPTVLVLKYMNGYEDAHSSLGYIERNTAPTDTLSNLGLWTFDYLFSKNNKVIKSGICNTLRCQQASDHLPIWSKISIADPKKEVTSVKFLLEQNEIPNE